MWILIHYSTEAHWDIQRSNMIPSRRVVSCSIGRLRVLTSATWCGGRQALCCHVHMHGVQGAMDRGEVFPAISLAFLSPGREFVFRECRVPGVSQTHIGGDPWGFGRVWRVQSCRTWMHGTCKWCVYLRCPYTYTLWDTFCIILVMPWSMGSHMVFSCRWSTSPLHWASMLYKITHK